MESVKRTQKRKPVLSTSENKKLGRPSQWTEHFLQIFIVLRLCGLEIKEILKLVTVLSGGVFEPEARNSQRIIREILWEGYHDFCNVNTETLRTRILCTKLLKPPKMNFISFNAILSCHNLASAQTKDATSDANSMTPDLETDRTATEPHLILNMPPNDFSSNRPSDYYTSRSGSIGSSNYLASEASSTMGMSISSQRSTRTTSIASYKDTFRNVLKRGSRTSSCISEIVSLLGRFSLDETTSTYDSIDQTSKQNESTLPDNASSQSIPEPQFSGFDNFSHPRIMNPVSGVLEQHTETVRKHNLALLTACCGCSETNDCVHSEIIRATLCVNGPSFASPSILYMVKRPCNYMETDCYGNNLLFFAARVGAPLSVLLAIIQNTPDLNSLNTDGHNFLFVLDPLGFDYSQSDDYDFATLLDVLGQRHFNFDHLDHNGRSFLLFLCLRPSFRMSWITLLFRRDPRRIRRFARQRDSSGAYLVGYLAGQSDLAILHRDILSIIYEPEDENWKRFNGMTKLHNQVIKHLELSIAYHPKWPYTKQRDTNSLIYSCGWDAKDINNYDSDGYTPLTLFAYEALSKCPPVSDQYIISQIQGLVGWGADVNSRCRNGDTILHMAARKCNFKVLQLLTSYRIQINHQNGAGLRAIDCLPSMAGRLTSSLWRMFIEREPALQCLLLLQDHGSRPYFM